jgi:FlaA1/EpsC-like NDP-sugar epimerase
MPVFYEKLKFFKKYMLFLLDFVIWNASFYLSFAINKNSFSLLGYESIFIQYLAIVNLCFLFVFIAFRVYDRIWRYADIEDFFYAGLSILCAFFLFFSGTVLCNMNAGIRIYILFLLLNEFLGFVIRIMYRINIVAFGGNGGKDGRRLMIIGAGEATSIVLREISRHSERKYLPVCAVDDDRTKIGRSVAGVKVQGSTYEIRKICKREKIEVILFSIVNISLVEKRRILDICSRTGAEVRVIPSIYDAFTSGAEIVPSIRHVEIEDLLGREPVAFDGTQYGGYITGKTVLITGGGGSIGSELCRQIAALAPKKLIVLDIYENNAYEIQQELFRMYKSKLNLEVEIASVRDSAKLEKIFSEKKIDVVFHAAAHKHVPLMEHNPEEAVKNNVFGTFLTAEISEKYAVKKFVLISTDKAVNPTSIMGATKRICEMIIQMMARHSRFTEFTAVRFGNVLGSNGSVIPLFKEQIKHNGPVTVTHPDIIRYFMTISEAVSLVLTAGSIARGGEIFVLDMGEPVKIKDLAENLIRLSGLKPYEDIKIEFTGLRPGEKLFEELLMDEEGIIKTENEKIYIGSPIKFNEEKFRFDLQNLKESYQINDAESVKSALCKIVPIANVRS